MNESEAEALMNHSVKTIEDAAKACQAFLARDGFSIGVILTLSESGCVFGDRNGDDDQIKHFPTIKVKAVDTVVREIFLLK